MAMDLLELVTKGLGNDFTSKIASVISESPHNTQGALDSVLPLLLGGMTRRAATPEGAADVLGLINRHGTDPAQLANLPNLLSGSNLVSLTTTGSSVVGSLFGANTGGIWNALAGLAGVRPQSANTLVTAATPLVLGLLRGLVSREGLGASGLASLLFAQRDTLSRRLPDSLARSVGWGAPSTWFASEPRIVATPPRSGLARWLPWIIAILLGIWLLLMLSRCGRETEVTPSATSATGELTAPVTAPSAVNIYFDSGSATPAADASVLLSSLAAYAKANPGRRVAVSGYHDPSGNTVANEELARNRAVAVRDLLVEQGVPASGIELDKPLVTTGGGEERESRRVEVSIR